MRARRRRRAPPAARLALALAPLAVLLAHCTLAFDPALIDQCGCAGCPVCPRACASATDGTPCLGGTCHAGGCCTGCWDDTRHACTGGDDALSCGEGGIVCQQCRVQVPLEVCRNRNCAAPTRVRDVSAGVYYTCALVGDDGRVQCFGSTSDDAIGVPGGDGYGAAHPAPNQLDGLTGATQVSAGERVSCAVQNDAQVVCWGNNIEYALAAPAPGLYPAPQMVGPFRKVDVGAVYACAIDANQALYCWGWNNVGQIGDGVQANAMQPVPIMPQRRWLEVSAGFGATCAIDSDHTLWCWGANTEGQLGRAPSAMPQLTPRPVDSNLRFVRVSCGAGFTCAIDTDGALWCFGQNDLGQLGQATTGASDPTLRRVGTQTFVQVAAGPRTVTGPAMVPHVHACAVDTAGAAWCWGTNATGELANGEAPDPAPALPARVQYPRRFAAITVGAEHTCAIDVSDTLYCWGGGGGWGATAQRPEPVPSPTPVILQ